MSELSGIQKRAYNRTKLDLKREANARKIVDKLVDINTLFKTEHPQREFNAMWYKVDEELKNNRLFKGYIAYADAYNLSVHYCQDLIEDADIEIGFPKLIVITSRPKNFRDQAWFNDAKEVLSYYLRWMSKLENSSNPDITDVFLSLIFHSAVLKEHNLNQILIDLNDDKLSLNNVYQLPVITLIIDNNNLATNTYIDTNKGNKAIHETKVFISPLTARLIQLFLKRNNEVGKSQTKKEISVLTAHSIYKKVDIYTDVSQIPTKMGLKRFLLASVYVLEDYLDISIPEQMWYLLTNQEQTYAIPTQNWQSIVHDVKHNVFKTALKTNEPLDKIPSNTNNHNNKKSSLITDIAKLFKKTAKFKISKKDFTSELTHIHSNLLSNDAPLNEIAITGWLLLKTDNCKVSSIYTYSSRITNHWLSISDGMQLEEFDEEDFYYFYNELIELSTSEKQKQYKAIHIDEIHQYLVNEHGIEHIAKLSSKIRPHYKTGYISENMFQAIFAQVNSLKTDKGAIDAIKLSLILGHRCGLRTGEIVKLKLTDLALLSYLEVRNNKYGDNKTSSALRRILLDKLLTKQDTELLKKVYATRSFGDGDTLIANQAGTPYTSNELSKHISTLIKETTGLNYLTTHHLRHSCLTNFQLMSFLYDNDYEFNNHECFKWLVSLLPYDEDTAKQILLNIEGALAYKKVFALAGLSGHASPSTTYASYVHLTDIQIGLLLWHCDFKLSKKHASVIKLPRRKKDLINNYLGLNAYLTQKSNLRLLPKPQSYQKLKGSQLQAKVKRRYSFDEVSFILDKFSKKEDYKSWLIKFNIDYETFATWLNNATLLKEDNLFKTNRKKSRLFAHKDKLRLIPYTDRFDGDKKMLENMTNKFRELYQNKRHKLNKSLLHKFVIHSLTNTEFNSNSIKFNSHDELLDFMKVLPQMVYKKDIRISIYNYKNASLREQQRWSKTMASFKNYAKNITYVDSHDITYLRKVRAEISLASQTEAERIEARVSSPNPINQWTVRTIQIFCQYAFIMIGERIISDSNVLKKVQINHES